MTEPATVSLRASIDNLTNALGRSFEETGFAIVSDHGIDRTTIERATKAARALFALSDAAKRRYHQPGIGGARGYTPFGVERAKDADVHDLKEFWHIGRPLPPADPLEVFMPPNIWPVEVPELQEASLALFVALEDVGLRILQAIALHLRLERDFFAPTMANGNSVLRLLHYPPVAPERAGAIRAAAHEDINAITLLLDAEEAGLELLGKDGCWVPVSPPPGALAVNIGDMLQRLTAGRLRSTTHRVINPIGATANRSRYSMPFFLHFRPDYVIMPLDLPGAAREPEPPIAANDYLLQRLREINLS